MNTAFKNQIKKILIPIGLFFLLGSLYAQVLYKVDGYVFLENSVDTGTHAGVKVNFYNLPSMELEDFTVSQASGYSSINVLQEHFIMKNTKLVYRSEIHVNFSFLKILLLIH